MTMAAENALRLLVLAIPALLGLIAARAKLFKDLGATIDGLNGFALYFGFPALIVAGILDGDFSLPTELGFWLAVPLSQALLLLVVPVLARIGAERSQAGTLALVGLFGNVAYLGLPLAIEVFGAAFQGVIALIVSLHVAIAVSLGPLLLARWSGAQSSSWTLKTVLKQPLVWAPVIGLAGRALPDHFSDGMLTAISPLASAAAPVALFLLGLYIWDQRSSILSAERGVWMHVAIRLVIAPVSTCGVVLGLVAAELLANEHGAILIVLAGMPAAITTFSISHAADIGVERVASAIVRSTLLALLSLPLLATLARMLLE